MLKLEKMELIGFKSFSGRTEVAFPEGITAVVGPNGCGKSNIGDAISWVLGEQSAKSLRGDKMEDVIFNGSELMKPLGMAEVSLYFTHDNGASGDGQEEITLTRRLFRSGESEYSVNGERCRLKDITDLLSQSRIGAKTCAVIEQGRVEEIMNARPVDRRLIIEEAAGIIGYKGKRRIAETKLEATHGNLLRVQDIVNEVERQMRSLKRQASRARRYANLKEEMREKQAILFISKNQGFLSRLAETERILNGLKEEEAERLAQMGVVEATLERGRQELLQAEEDLTEMIEQAHDLDKKIHEEEANARNAAEKGRELESAVAKILEDRHVYQIKISQMDKALSEKEEEKLHVNAEKELFQHRIEKHEKELKELKEKEAQVSNSLDEGREQLFKEANELSENRNRFRIYDLEKNKLDVSLDKKRREVEEEDKNIREIMEALARHGSDIGDKEQELVRLRSHQQSYFEEKDRLKDSLNSEEQDLSSLKVNLSSLLEKENIYNSPEANQGTIDEGTQAILSGKVLFDRGHKGIVADWIKMEENYEKAVQGYLKELLPALCVKSLDDARHGMELLEDAKAGSGRFLFVSSSDRIEEKPEIPKQIRDHESFMGRLSEKVHFEDGVEKNLKPILDQCIVAQNMKAAQTFYQWHPYLNYVTPGGEVIRSRVGLAFQIKEGNGKNSPLTMTERLDTIKKEIEAVTVELTEKESRVLELQKELGAKEETEKEILAKIRNLETEVLTLRHDEKQYSEKLSYAKKKSQILREELSVIENEKKANLDHSEEVESIVLSTEDAFTKNEENIQRLKGEHDHLKELISVKSEALSALYAEHGVPSGKAASLESDILHLKKNLEDLRERVENTWAGESSGRAKMQELKNSGELSRETVERMIGEQDQAQSGSEKLKEEIAAKKESLSSREQEIKQIRLKLDEIRTAMKEKELERAELRGDIKYNAEACLEELTKGIDEVEAQIAIPEDIEEEILAEEIAALKEKIQRIGPINMMAIEEFDKLEERYQFLVKQRKDLTDSIESLKETIKKINRTSREKFQEAFQGINEGFNETFKVLFNGGRAALRLEDEKDILESGVEIIAQPPGKKLQNMNLLSGGEKALSVIALLFAVFRFQPSPFCLLDEVDSSLDDVNIEKFINMLKNFSDKTQFILITHNKKTMEVANLLYGVTMEEPGVSKIISMKLN